MPRYCFVCDNCGCNLEVVRPMVDAEKLWRCPCGKKMQRNYAAEMVMAGKGEKSYSRAIHSDSLAISPTQVKEHQKLFPDIKLDNQCRPIFDSYQKHEAYLKKTGFIKNPGKSRKRGKRIA